MALSNLVVPRTKSLVLRKKTLVVLDIQTYDGL